MNLSLNLLAESHGIQTKYLSEMGEPIDISDQAKRALLKVLKVDPNQGREGEFAKTQAEATLACILPRNLEGRQVWGITCQLYSLRSSRNLGIGDFEDLSRLAEIGAAEGAAFIGVNPLHALFLADPGRCSPYSPSTRRFLNPLYIAVDKLEGAEEVIAAARNEEPAAFKLSEREFVDYAIVGSLKIKILRRIFDALPNSLIEGGEFGQFQQKNSATLRSFALFEALSAEEVKAGRQAGWHRWPNDLQNRHTEAVMRFEATHEKDIRFYEWLQFIADRQLGEAQTRARRAGMRIGLYLDFAVGVAPDGAETWIDPELAVRDARVGSPPDMYNSEGQDWGLAPLSPQVLAARRYMPLADSYHALMKHAGAVRIDHAMGLARLWWIPAGREATIGGYVRYPLGAMIDTVVKASRANDTLVIGEDLGTVPDGFRSAMEAANILSYRVLYFQRSRSGDFVVPAEYPEISLACISTHDLATLAGWWAGSDIKLRVKTGRQTEEASARDIQSRQQDRRALLKALYRENLLTREDGDVLSGARDVPVFSQKLAIAIHRFGARTKSLMFAVQIEDMVLSPRQPNLPGTIDEYPNWRIRLAVPVEDLVADPCFQKIARAMREERPEIS